MTSRRIFLKNLAEILPRSDVVSKETSIVIFDRNLLQAVPGFRLFIKKFRNAYPVRAGEGLKSFEAFTALASKIHKDLAGEVTRDWSVVAMGGGSVGDAAGFFASVYRRGLRLVHIPTTWLSAVDSSHGGKTALNLGGAKNQIGTFYEATETILVRSLLLSLSKNHVLDSLGEFAKMSILDPRVKLRANDTAEDLWAKLPKAIDAKLKIVRRDPTETRGDRQLLNLGHTMGHVFEIELGLSHGRSVGLGLLFAIDASKALGDLTANRAEVLRSYLRGFGFSKDGARVISASRAQRLLRQDKKRTASSSVTFITIRDFGRCQRRSVSVSRLIHIGRETGWLK